MTPQAYVLLLFGCATLAEAYQTQAAWLYLIAATVLGLFAVSAVLALWPLRKLRVQGVLPWMVRVGEPLRWVLSFETILDAPVQVLLADHESRPWIGWWRARLVPFGWQMARLDGAQMVLDVSFQRRGKHPLPPLRVQSAHPFGLVVFSRLLRLPGEVLVTPQADSVDEMPWLFAHTDAQGRRTPELRRGAAAPRGLRLYQSGDALREIHWRSSARLGRLYVKETEQETGATIRLYLDMRAATLAGVMQEHVVQVAVSFYQAMRDRGFQVVLDVQPEAWPDVSAFGLHRDRAFFALVEGSSLAGPPRCGAGDFLVSADPACVKLVGPGHFIFCAASDDPLPGAGVVCPVGVAPGLSLAGVC